MSTAQSFESRRGLYLLTTLVVHRGLATLLVLLWPWPHLLSTKAAQRSHVIDMLDAATEQLHSLAGPHEAPAQHVDAPTRVGECAPIVRMHGAPPADALNGDGRADDAAAVAHPSPSAEAAGDGGTGPQSSPAPFPTPSPPSSVTLTTSPGGVCSVPRWDTGATPLPFINDRNAHAHARQLCLGAPPPPPPVADSTGPPTLSSGGWRSVLVAAVLQNGPAVPCVGALSGLYCLMLSRLAGVPDAVVRWGEGVFCVPGRARFKRFCCGVATAMLWCCHNQHCWG